MTQPDTVYLGASGATYCPPCGTGRIDGIHTEYGAVDAALDVPASFPVPARVGDRCSDCGVHATSHTLMVAA